jgi:hypothetical protein
VLEDDDSLLEVWSGEGLSLKLECSLHLNREHAHLMPYRLPKVLSYVSFLLFSSGMFPIYEICKSEHVSQNRG